MQEGGDLQRARVGCFCEPIPHQGAIINSTQQPLQDRCLRRRGYFGSETSDITGVGKKIEEQGTKSLNWAPCRTLGDFQALSHMPAFCQAR